MLHEQCYVRYENIFTSCGRGAQDIARSPHPLGVQPCPSHKADNAVHISRYRWSSSKSHFEGMGPGFTSSRERFPYVLVKTYSLLILIAVQDTRGPCFALGEPLTFYHSQVHTLPSYLGVGASLHSSKLQKGKPS
jgi:hypothetical protein